MDHTQTHQPTAHKHPSRTCTQCGISLTVHEAVSGSLCSDIACSKLATSNPANQQVIAREQNLDKIAKEFVLQQFGSTFTAARVPSRESQLSPQDPDRIKRFRENLRRELSKAKGKWTSNADLNGTLNVNSEDYAEVSNILHHCIAVERSEKEISRDVDSVSCITCGGHCCGYGGEHAFLKEQHLLQILKNNSSSTPASLYRYYLRQLPKTSYKGSCVYHTETGCSLSRNYRSQICNTHQCDGRLNYSSLISKRQSNLPSNPVVVVAMNSIEITRSRVIDSYSDS